MYDSHVSWFASLPILGFPRQLKNPKGLPNHHFPIPCLKFPCSESWYVQFFFSFLLYKSLIAYFISYHWLSPSLFGQNPQKSQKLPMFSVKSLTGELDRRSCCSFKAQPTKARGGQWHARPWSHGGRPSGDVVFSRGNWWIIHDNPWNIDPVYLPTFGWFLG